MWCHNNNSTRPVRPCFGEDHCNRSHRFFVLLLAILLLLSGVARAQPEQNGGMESGFEGLVKPSRRVVLNAPVDGRLARIVPKEAESVKQGEVLVQMHDAIQRAVVERTSLQAADETPVAFAKLGLEEAQLRLDRVSRSFENDAANELEVISARVARNQAEVRLEAAREELARTRVELKLERERLKQFYIEAPFDGVVSNVVSDAGARLTREEPILELVSLHPLEAEVHLPAASYGRLEVGGSYELRASPPVGGTVTAKLERVIPLIDPGSRTFKAVFAIQNPDRALPSGFSVWLPVSALQDAGTLLPE